MSPFRAPGLEPLVPMAVTAVFPPTLVGQDLFSAEHQLCLVREQWGTERSPSPSAGRHGKSL